MSHTFPARYKQFLADALIIASVEYASEDQVNNPNPFNDLFGRHEPQEYWGICKVVEAFIELLRHNFYGKERAYTIELLQSAFVSLYGKSYDPLESIGASIQNRPISYSARSRECVRIAEYLLTLED